MKSLMKTIGLFGLLLMLITVASCNKEETTPKPQKEDQLYAIPTFSVSPDKKGNLNDTSISPGVLIGTKAELEKYIDQSLAAAKKADENTPPEPQAMSLYAAIGHKYNMFINDHGTPYPEAACMEMYYWYYQSYYQENLEMANNACMSIIVTYQCPFNDQYYSYMVVSPNNGCTIGDPAPPEPPLPTSVLYNNVKIYEYPFDKDETGPKVAEYMKSISLL